MTCRVIGTTLANGPADHMNDLASFIEAHKREIMAAWQTRAIEALSLAAEDQPKLLNDLPAFIDELIVCLREGTEQGNHRGSARAHGRQRKHIGLDIGGLAIEFSLITIAVLDLTRRHGHEVADRELEVLLRTIAQGTEQSVTEYAALRDREISEQAARHYSFVAHELRTPLHNARLATALLEHDIGDPRAHLERVGRALDAVAGIVDDSLVSARIRVSPQPRYEDIELAAVVGDVIDACRLAADRRRLELVSELGHDRIEADRRLLTSVLVNLVANAIKFSHIGHAVTVRVTSVDDRVRFEVIDACGGMPEDLPGRLFQPYAQEGSDRSGFGLGLMIVKQAVDAHGGTVRIDNSPGVGCCFIVELPRARMQSPGEPA